MLTIEQINAQYGKLPPQAVEVEEAVLGALMLERDAYVTVADIIDTSSFYKEEHQKIFEAIKYLSANEKPVDLLMVTQQLKDREQLDKVGGPGYITQLTRRVASAAHIEFHSRIIAQKYIQRELIRVSSEIQSKAYDDTIDVDDLLDFSKTEIIGVNNLIVNSCKPTRTIIKEESIELEKDAVRYKEGISPGIPTGLIHLNYVTGGWRKTDLIILAARPSVGKSSLSFFFDRVASKNDFWVNHYSFEMSNGKIHRINLSAETGISRSNLRDGNLNDEDWIKINNANSRLYNSKVLWNDNSKLNVNHIMANTVRNVNSGKCDFLVVDYLQLIKPTDKRMVREQQIAEISRALKEIAMTCDIPVLALSQLNRDVEKRADKEPTMGDLRESGAIEQDADMIMFMWDKDNPKLKIEKNRNGSVGYIDFWTNKERTIFKDKNNQPF